MMAALLVVALALPPCAANDAVCLKRQLLNLDYKLEQTTTALTESEALTKQLSEQRDRCEKKTVNVPSRSTWFLGGVATALAGGILVTLLLK